jgi:hypothetical protein
VNDPSGARYRVNRGGSFNYTAADARSGFRFKKHHGDFARRIGNTKPLPTSSRASLLAPESGVGGSQRAPLKQD